jgi:hypothetical protein
VLAGVVSAAPQVSFPCLTALTVDRQKYVFLKLLTSSIRRAGQTTNPLNGLSCVQVQSALLARAGGRGVCGAAGVLPLLFDRVDR